MASKAGMTMQGLAAMAFGVLTIIIAFTIIPMVGSEMDQAVVLPATGSVGSQWNSTVNADIPTAVDFWESVGGILKVAGFIIVVVGFIRALQGLRQ